MCGNILSIQLKGDYFRFKCKQNNVVFWLEAFTIFTAMKMLNSYNWVTFAFMKDMEFY
jgi:hypothetical protein